MYASSRWQDRRDKRQRKTRTNEINITTSHVPGQKQSQKKKHIPTAHHNYQYKEQESKEDRLLARHQRYQRSTGQAKSRPNSIELNAKSRRGRGRGDKRKRRGSRETSAERKEQRQRRVATKDKRKRDQGTMSKFNHGNISHI